MPVSPALPFLPIGVPSLKSAFPEKTVGRNRRLSPPFPQSPFFLLSTCHRNIPSKVCSVWGSCSLQCCQQSRMCSSQVTRAQCLLFPRLRSWGCHPYCFQWLCLAETTSCSFVQTPQKPGGKQKYVSKDRNMASLEGIPCLIPATANSDPGSVEGQHSGVPQLCSAPWALSAWRFSVDRTHW